MVRALIALVFFFLTGCAKREPFPVVFRPFESSEHQAEEVATSRPVPKVSVLADGMPFRDFASLLVNEAGISISFAEDMDEKPVSLSVLDQPVDQVLNSVARRLGSQVTKQGDIYFVGQLRSEDRVTLIDRLPGHDVEGLRTILATQVGEYGRYFVGADGLVILSDRSEVILRAAETLKKLRTYRPGVWVVQLVILSLTDRQRIEAGLSVDQVARVAVDVAGSIRALDASSSASATFAALLRASSDSSHSAAKVHPLFLVVPGHVAMFSDGEVVPVPRKVVSDQGTVTTVGFDRISTGSEFSVTILESAGTSAILSVHVKQSEIVGYIEASPITNQQEFSTRAVIDSGGVYLLGEFSKARRSATASGPLVPTLFGRENRSDSLTLWAQVVRL